MRRGRAREECETFIGRSVGSRFSNATVCFPHRTSPSPSRVGVAAVQGLGFESRQETSTNKLRPSLRGKQAPVRDSAAGARDLCAGVLRGEDLHCVTMRAPQADTRPWSLAVQWCATRCEQMPPWIKKPRYPPFGSSAV